MKFQFTAKSSNVKTGPIPTTMTERASCPETCALRNNGCYADNFPLALHWNRVSEKGIDEKALLDKIRELPAGQLWRHNVAGDLPHIAGVVSTEAMVALAEAAKHTKPIIYTHHKLNEENQALFRGIRAVFKVTVNSSCESIAEAEAALDAGINAVVVVPSNAPKSTYKTDRGTSIVTCPATQNDTTTCASCGLCSRDRVQKRVVVAFPAHGAKHKRVSLTVA